MAKSLSIASIGLRSLRPMAEEICTVKGCKNNKERGDIFFCPPCRVDWRGFCKLNGIEEIPIPDNELDILLAAFREGK